MNTSDLLNILHTLDFSDLEEQVKDIHGSNLESDADLIVALVGEFNAGKTTIINSLIESKNLETAPVPTTSTIYTIRFGAKTPHATIRFRDGSTLEVDDFSQLKNKELEEDAVVVDVQDTSTSLPENVVLVDTPGLSSGNNTHTSVLIEFLPNADAVLLVVDIQAEPTNSLMEFVRTANLSGCPMYLVLTKSDTKSPGDINKIRETLLKDTDLPVKDVITVSAKEGDMENFHQLLKQLENDKKEILSKRAEMRLRAIAEEALARVEKLLSASQSVEKLDNAVEEQENELRRIRERIEELSREIDHDTERMRTQVSQAFEQVIYERLESIVAGGATDYDAEAISTINSVSSLMVSQYKNAVLQLFAQLTIQGKRRSDRLTDSLADIDLSGIGISALSYDINLNEAGHQYDARIANGIKVVAVAAALYAIAGVGAGAAGAAAKGVGSKVATAVNVADTASDIGSIISNHRMMKRIERMGKFGQTVNNTLKPVNEVDRMAGQTMGKKRGLVESLVGFVTERSHGKPQRRRAIYNYITSTLAPAFNLELLNITRQINSLVISALESAAEERCEELSSKITALNADRKADAVEYEKKIATLKSARQQLSLLIH